MSSSAELACVYAALILHDDGVEITSDKLTALVKAAKVEIEPFWTGLFAKALGSSNIGDLISNIGSASAAPAPAAAAPVAGGAAAASEPKKEKKEESEAESDDDMGFGLFD